MLRTGWNHPNRVASNSLRWSDPADSPLDDALLRAQCTVNRLGIVGCRHVLPPLAQDILVEYLDIAASTPGMVVIGTSNLDLSHLVERFQSRFQKLRVDPPETEAVVGFILRWRIGKKAADMIAVGSHLPLHPGDAFILCPHFRSMFVERSSVP